jgi:hypothetical protein
MMRRRVGDENTVQKAAWSSTMSGVGSRPRAFFEEAFIGIS